MTVSCCKHHSKHKTCKNKKGKTFSLPRKFPKKKCRFPRGFTMKASCTPYKDCFVSPKKKISKRRTKKKL